MKATPMRLFFLLAFGSVAGAAQTGDLEPPGPPAPTMVTLQDIYDRFDGCPGGGLEGVPKTGQTTSYASGDDGEYQAGVSVDPRFTDNGDGTVKDNLTGLIWVKDASCFGGSRSWDNALSDANGLASGSCGLADGSVAGEWRLPNVRELHSLIDFGQSNPALPPGHPFSGVPPNDSWWSATTFLRLPSYAWFVNVETGDIYASAKVSTGFVWPVRTP